MTENKMYSQRAKQGNIAFHRGCGDKDEKWCDYCAFERLIQMNKNCPDCMVYKPHTHPEVLNKKPPKTNPGEFVTFSLAGEVSFMKDSDWLLAWDYMRKYPKTTFLIQSKDPECFLPYRSGISQIAIPSNIILGTTIESNKRDYTPLLYHTDFPHYDYISAAPYPDERYEAMLKLTCRKAVTIEPILSFDENVLVEWILKIQPEFVYVGYNSKKGLRLPEPPLEKTLELIAKLREAGVDVREKSIRKAWWERGLK